MYYVPLPDPKQLLRFFVEVTNLYASIYTGKQTTGIRIFIHTCYAVFEPTVPVDSVNIFAVFTVTTQQQPDIICHHLPDNTQQINTEPFLQPPQPGFIYSPGKYVSTCHWPQKPLGRVEVYTQSRNRIFPCGFINLAFLFGRMWNCLRSGSSR